MMAPQAKGQHEARLLARRAPLRALQALAADVGLSDGVAQHWRDRRMNLGQAEADSVARVRLRGKSMRGAKS